MKLAAQLLLLYAFPPLLLGVINRVKAMVAGRRGPPLWQPYADLWRLLRKGAVYSEVTTWVFRAGPVVSLAAVALAALLLPLGTRLPAVIAFEGDVVLFAYLLGMGRFFTVLAAMDTGSAFEGMGASREVTFSALAEPALFLAVGALAVARHSLSWTTILGGGTEPYHQFGPAMLLIIASLVLVALAENSRIPFDDPNTHLELTMVHEVMVLDHSGPDFAFILYGASLKLLLLGALVVRLALPFQALVPGQLAQFAAGMLAFAVVVGLVESTMARLRLPHVPNILISASVISAFAVAIVLVRGNP